MQYFRHQLEARQLSRRLVLLFMLGVACVTVAISGVLLTLAATLSNGLFFFRLPDGPWVQEHPAAVIATVVLVLGIMAAAVLLKRIELREGGGAVARSLGGERVAADSSDVLYRRLNNVVEEMAIAAGIAVPEVYVLPREAGINAFAAGLTPADAAIAVTRGALDVLTRDELQGVVAHEFSHIVNNDIRLNMNLIGWLHGLMALSVIARGMLRFSTGGDSRDRRGGLLMVWLAALAVMVLGYLGMIFGRLLQAAVARRREALADASAVQFTRNPDGLRNALLKIAASDNGAQLQQVSTDEVAHLLFFPPGEHWFATHPPLAERIGMLGAKYDAAELQRMRLQLQQPAPAVIAVEPDVKPKVRSPATFAEPYLQNLKLSTAEVVASVGNSQPQHLQFAQQLRRSLPAMITSAAASTDAAVALLFALSLDRESDRRAAQLSYVGQSLGHPVAARVQGLLDTVDALNPRQRQPALLRLLPQLRQLPDVTRTHVSSCLRAVTQMAGPMSVEKYALCKLAQSQLHDAFAGRAHRGGPITLAQAQDALTTLLLVLTQQGHDQPQQARLAYECAMRHLGLRGYPEYAPIENYNRLLDAALLSLDRLHPMGKQALLEAMMLAVLHDEQITIQEAELLRAFCACLHCPLPPLLQAEAAQA